MSRSWLVRRWRSFACLQRGGRALAAFAQLTVELHRGLRILVIRGAAPDFFRDAPGGTRDPTDAQASPTQPILTDLRRNDLITVAVLARPSNRRRLGRLRSPVTYASRRTTPSWRSSPRPVTDGSTSRHSRGLRDLVGPACGSRARADRPHVRRRRSPSAGLGERAVCRPPLEAALDAQLADVAGDAARGGRRGEGDAGGVRQSVRGMGAWWRAFRLE